MPWTCPTCAVDLHDDVDTCETCGATKDAWTLQAEVTRQLQITKQRAKLEVFRGEEVAQSCPVLPKAELLRLHAAGAAPEPVQRLRIRVTPRKQARDVLFGVDFALREEDEHELEGPAGELSEGAFELLVLCVAGEEDVSAISLEGLHLVDVSEASERGFAPSVEISAVRKSVELPTELVVPEVPAVELLEVEDVCFATARAVLLPGGWSHADELTGLSVISAALEYARKHPERRLLVAGHTDAVGSEASNLTLSRERATNVSLYLSGQREAWAEHSLTHGEVADVQAVLKWIAWIHEWDTDPGPVDGDWGAGSKRARDAFRERYNAEFSGELAAGKQRAADWAAFYDLYELELAQKLTTEVSQLAPLRAGLARTDPELLACGEAWPTQRPGAPATDAANRRVDVLFFDATRVPDLTASPPGASVYGPDAFERRYLSVEDAFKEPMPPYGDAAFSEDCPFLRVHVEAT